MWALIRKEMLENVRWLPLALLLNCSLTGSAVASGWLDDLGPLMWNTIYGSSLLALGCGLLQSIPDQRNGARAYLLHRGVSAAEVFWAKTLVGFALVFVFVAIPLTLCAVWLNMRGIANGPGRPIQVLPAAIIALAGFLFHPTMILIICRPARWLGSRVVPIMVPITVVIYCQSTLDGEIGARKLWMVMAVSSAALIVMVLAARQAYVNLAGLPAPSSTAHGSASVAMVIAVGMWMVVAGVGIAIFSVDQAFRARATSYYVPVLNKSDRQFWLVHVQDRWNSEKNEREAVFLNGAPLVSGRVPDVSGPVPTDFQVEHTPQLYSQSSVDIYGKRDIAYRPLYGVLNGQRWNVLVDRRGYLLCYENAQTPGGRLGQVISRDGIRDPKRDWGQPFDGALGIGTYQQLGLIADRNGIYRIDESKRTVVPLIQHSTDLAAVSWVPGEPLKVLLRSGTTLSVYELSKDGDMFIVPKEASTLKLTGELTPALRAEIELPEIMAELPHWHVSYRGPDDWMVHGTNGVGSYAAGSIARKSPGQPVVTFTVEAPPEVYTFSMRDVRLASLLSVPLPTLLAPFYTYLTAGRQQHKSLAEVSSVPAGQLPGVVATFLLQGLIAAILAWFAARRRSLSRRAAWLWTGLGLALGWAMPLAVLACYPRIVREVCTHCQKPRRIDAELCEHCHATWEQPQREGIEIIEHEFDGVGQSSANAT